MPAQDAIRSLTRPARAGQDRAGAGAALAQKLQAIEAMDYGSLREAWTRLYAVPPPARVGRDLLQLGIAWKLQEQAYGGIRPALRRRLAALAAKVEETGDVPRDRTTRLKPGVKLVRDWNGSTHTVTVLEEGFEWQGRTWRSLTGIAGSITGVHWSGPRFFGLKGKEAVLVRRAESADA